MTIWLLISLMPAAHAHEPGLSSLSVTPDALSWTLSATDSARLTDAGALLESTALTVEGSPCANGPAVVVPVDGDGVRVDVPMDCPTGDAWALRADWLDAMPPGHRLFVEAFEAPAGVLSAQHNAVAFAHEASSAQVGVQFVQLGVQHIVTGYDHLAFLLGLLLVARSLKQMAGIVSGFTIAHSLTLSTAALGVLSLPGWLVEPAIALSIAAVGVENLFDPPAKRRFWLTMGLGLIHGFGFAGMLAELGLPEGSQLWALVAFNSGVELGQMAVVAALLPLLLWLRRSERWCAWTVRLGSLGLVGLGHWWFFQRLFGG